MKRAAFSVLSSAALHLMLLCVIAAAFEDVKPAVSMTITASLRRIERPAPQAAGEPEAAPLPAPVEAPKPETVPPPPAKPERPKEKPKPAEKPKPRDKQPQKETPPKETARAPEKPAPDHSAASGSQTAAPQAPAPAGQRHGLPIGGAGKPAIIDASSLKVIKKVNADYPMICRKRREQGTVILLVDIVYGKAASIRVERLSGHAPLDDAAVRAVREWRFDTSDYGDRVTARIPFKFELR